MRWAFAQAPTFDNQIARLDLRGRDAQLCIEKTLPQDWRAPRLHTSLSLGIAPKAGANATATCVALLGTKTLLSRPCRRTTNAAASAPST